MGAAQVATAGNMVANDSQGTSKSFAQLVQHGNTLMDAGPARGLTLGSDFNGLNGMMGPRFGPKAPSGSSAQQNGIRYLNVVTPPGMIVHPTNPMMRPSTIMSAKGTRTFNYNVAIGTLRPRAGHVSGPTKHRTLLPNRSEHYSGGGRLHPHVGEVRATEDFDSVEGRFRKRS